MSGAGILAGKLAFVTGAGSGIGRATCKILAREGASVIAADKNLNGAKETSLVHDIALFDTGSPTIRTSSPHDPRRPPTHSSAILELPLPPFALGPHSPTLSPNFQTTSVRQTPRSPRHLDEIYFDPDSNFNCEEFYRNHFLVDFEMLKLPKVKRSRVERSKRRFKRMIRVTS